MKMLSAVEFENASSRNRAEPVEIWKTRKFIEEIRVKNFPSGEWRKRSIFTRIISAKDLSR